MTGMVSETFLFKDSLLQSPTEISLLPDTVIHSHGWPADVQFGKLEVVSGSLIVIWSYSCLFILNPLEQGKSAVIGRCHGLLGSILDVKAMEDEILILRNSSQKPVIRLALGPEKEIAKGNYENDPK